MALHREEIEQRLGGMPAPAIARVDHRATDGPRDEVRRARLAGAHDEDVRA